MRIQHCTTPDEPRMRETPHSFLSVQQLINLTPSSSTQQSMSVAQPMNIPRYLEIAKIPNIAREHLDNQKSLSVRQPTSVQQPAKVPKLVRIKQTRDMRKLVGVQPMNIQQPTNLASFQLMNVQKCTNVSQPKNSEELWKNNQQMILQRLKSDQQTANVQEPTSVQQSESIQETATLQELVKYYGGIRQHLTVPPLSSFQQTANVQQFASVQQPSTSHYYQSVLRPLSGRNVPKDIIVKNVIPLSLKEMQKLVKQKKCKDQGGSLKVHLQKNKIKFVSGYNGNDILGVTNFKFKVTLVYRHLVRKWYISPGYSFVPEVINLKDKLKSGTHNPVSDEVMNIIYDVRRSIHAYIIRLTAMHEFIRDVRRRHRDMQFYLHPTLLTMELIFSEDAWPTGLRKLDRRDSIVVLLALDKKLWVRDVAYKYKSYSVVRKMQNEHTKKLQSVLTNFLGFFLKEAFDRFMEENYCSE